MDCGALVLAQINAVGIAWHAVMPRFFFGETEQEVR